MQPARRWRSVVKEVVASAIWRAHSHPFSAPLVPGRRQPLVVGYHRVVEDFAAASKTDMPAMLISRSMFERHVDEIGRHFHFVSLDEMSDHLARGVPFPRPVAALTFDDGYRDVYENVYPTLKRKGIPAAVFVVTELIGRACWQIHDRFYYLLAKAYKTWDDPWLRLTKLLADADIPSAELLRTRAAVQSPFMAVSILLPAISQADATRVMDYLDAHIGNGTAQAPATLTWSMLAEMRRAGFTIGSHTQTHAWLARESSERVGAELVESKQKLEARLGEPVVHFAYPGGQFAPSVVDAVARAGYRFAYTACQHSDPRYPSLTIPRLLLWEGSSIDSDGRFSPAILSCQAHGLWPPARGCERVHVG